jgi:excinuclease ABC subunit C
LLRLPDFDQPWEGVLPPFDNEPGLVLVHLRQGPPMLARTAMLRRRLNRLLGPKAEGSRLLDLSRLAVRLEVWRTPSKLEQSLLFYALAKTHFPDTYKKVVRLPTPPYIKLLRSIGFPRTQVTTRLMGKDNHFFGPFRSRAEADRMEKEMLDFFQLRRCEEDLQPHPDHPGCIYGEMNQCLRPCQAAVSSGEYSTEVVRLEDFLRSKGRSLAEQMEHARERASDNMEFEEAARQHRRLEKLDALLRQASDISGDIRQANGVSAVKAGSAVDLYFLWDGIWAQPVRLDMAQQAGESMDRRLRQVVEDFPLATAPLKEAEEHLALLARWYFSSWRDTEWLPFASREDVPYRKLVRMISRALTGTKSQLELGLNPPTT